MGLSSCIQEGCIVFYEQYNKKCPAPSTSLILCLMRRILRELGHKITKVDKCYDEDELIQEEFHTDIPEADWQLYTQTWNRYVEEVFEN
jgi:hypothetical protein